MLGSGRILTLRDLSEVELDDIVFEKIGQSTWRARTGLEAASKILGNMTVSGRIGSPRAISLKKALQLENHALATSYLLNRDPKPMRPASASIAKIFRPPADTITQRMVDEQKDAANRLEQNVELLKRRINRLKLKYEIEEQATKNITIKLEEAKEAHESRVMSQESKRLQREQREKTIINQHKQNVEMSLAIKGNIRTRKIEIERSKRASVAAIRQELATAHAQLSDEYDRELEEKHQKIVKTRMRILDAETRTRSRVLTQAAEKQELRKALLDAEKNRIKLSLKELAILQDKEKAISDLLATQQINKIDTKQKFTSLLWNRPTVINRPKSTLYSRTVKEVANA